MSLNLYTSLLKFNTKDIQFNNSIKNKIIKDDSSLFTGITIKRGAISLTNLCMEFFIHEPMWMNYNCVVGEILKHKCIFQADGNIPTVNVLRTVEDAILDHYCISHHNSYYEKTYSLKTGLDKHLCNFKFYKLESTSKIVNKKITTYPPGINNFILKITGVWENRGKLGLNYTICMV